MDQNDERFLKALQDTDRKVSVDASGVSRVLSESEASRSQQIRKVASVALVAVLVVLVGSVVWWQGQPNGIGSALAAANQTVASDDAVVTADPVDTEEVERQLQELETLRLQFETAEAELAEVAEGLMEIEKAKSQQRLVELREAASQSIENLDDYSGAFLF